MLMMDAVTKKQITELVKLRYPDECMIVGDIIVNELIDDFGRGTKDAGEKYRDTDDGYNFSVYELAILIFTGIQAMAALADTINRLIEKHKRQKDEQELLREGIINALLDAGMSRQDAESYCQEHL